MSYISALVNQNITYTKTARSGVIDGTADRMTISIPEWPSFSTITSLEITANDGTYTGAVVKLLTDAGGYANATPPAEEFVLAEWTGDIGPTLYIDCENAYAEDAHKCGLLHLSIEHADLGANEWFTVTVTGKATTPRTRESIDRTPFSGEHTRIIRYSSADDANIDLTKKLLRRDNPYGEGSINGGTFYPVFQDSSDILYIGSTKPFTRVLFCIPDAFANYDINIMINVDIWDGADWATLIRDDGTGPGVGTEASSLSHSGVVKIYPESDGQWQKTQIANDPVAAMADMIQDGDMTPMFIPPYRQLYWAKVSVTESLSPFDIRASKVVILKD